MTDQDRTTGTTRTTDPSRTLVLVIEFDGDTEEWTDAADDLYGALGDRDGIADVAGLSIADGDLPVDLYDDHGRFRERAQLVGAEITTSAEGPVVVLRAVQP